MQPDWSAYEQVVGKRWEAYAPRFERFARGGWLSWNWAAFFSTFAWLRCRKLHLWSWAYFFVSSPILITAALLLASDPCASALRASLWEPVAKELLRALFVLGWILPPLIADRLYFHRVRGLVESGAAADEKKRGTQAPVGAIVVQAAVLGVAIFGLPSYGNFTHKARVSEGRALVSQYKTPMVEYVTKHGRLPERVEDLGATLSGRYVSGVVLESDGTIRAVFGDKAGPLSGHSIQIEPFDRTLKQWHCRSEDLPFECLPSDCIG